MVIVTGSIQARPDTLDELVRVSLEHVHRSRAEPGCVSHDVHRDIEDPLRLVFVERWVDRAALLAHFAVPESGAFVRAASALADGQPEMQLYDAELAQL